VFVPALLGGRGSDNGLAVTLNPQVLVLYRKREGARLAHEQDVLARFRYNDLKGAARHCGGRYGI